MKKCPRCGESKELGEFHRDKSKRDGHRAHCKACVLARQKRHYDANREEILARNLRHYEANKEAIIAQKRDYLRRRRAADPEGMKADQRKRNIKSQYGLTVEEYEAIIARGCAICGTHEGTICLDHDHSNGKIRDALCVPCNAGLGHFRDDPALTEAATDYLRHHSEREPDDSVADSVGPASSPHSSPPVP